MASLESSTAPATADQLSFAAIGHLQRMAGNAAVAQAVARTTTTPRAVQRTPASDLIDKHSGILGLDEEALGAELAQRLPAEDAMVTQVFASLDNVDRDDVAFALTSSLSSARLGSLSETLRLILVREMVHGVVTDEEEGHVAAIWGSFGATLPAVAARNQALWKLSLEESDQLNALPAVRDIRNAFKTDVVKLASLYLDDNERGARIEAERLGLVLPGGRPNAKPPIAEPAYIEDVQAMARKVRTLQQSLRALTRIQVGHQVNMNRRDSISPPYLPAYFDPDKAPQVAPDGKEQPQLATWQQTKTQHDRLTAVVRGFASLYPSIYVLLQQDRLDELANAGTAEQARTAMEGTLRRTVDKIGESQTMLSSGDIAYFDLIALHSQLFTGPIAVPFTPAAKWSEPFNAALARGELANVEARQFWTKLGLGVVAAAALIAAPFTGGATAALLVGVGVGIGAGQAVDSWQKYLSLSTAADAAVRDDLALVAQGQVSGALVAAVMDTVGVFLDAYGAGVSVAARRAAAKAQFEALDAAMREKLLREARRRAGREGAMDAGLEAAGTALAVADELIEDEPEIEASGQQYVMEPPTSGDAPPVVSPIAVQRVGQVVTGEDFEAYVDRGLRRGEIRIPGIKEFDYIIPGQYTGSGWGIDRIGIAIDPAGRVHLVHMEMKMQQKPKLNTPSLGTQTGAHWTSDAIESLMTSSRPEARAAKERLRRALQNMYPGSTVDVNVMRDFLHRRLKNAKVVVFVPDIADLKRLWRQIGGLARHGRNTQVVKVKL